MAPQSVALPKIRDRESVGETLSNRQVKRRWALKRPSLTPATLARFPGPSNLVAIHVLFIVSSPSHSVVMKGRQQGRPTKWVSATMKEHVSVGKPGVKFEVWEKWKKNRRKLGTLTISVGGLRWRPHKGKLSKQRSWDAFAEWFAPE